MEWFVGFRANIAQIDTALFGNRQRRTTIRIGIEPYVVAEREGLRSRTRTNVDEDLHPRIVDDEVVLKHAPVTWLKSGVLGLLQDAQDPRLGQHDRIMVDMPPGGRHPRHGGRTARESIACDGDVFRFIVAYPRPEELEAGAATEID